MHGKALIFRPDSSAPAETLFDGVVPTLGFLQEAVGGYIEQVPQFETIETAEGPVRCVVLCNEQGKLDRLPLNRHATLLWHQAMLRITDEDGKKLYPRGLMQPNSTMPADVLVGPIVVITGDAELMREL
jgi:hypothetical protein